jgi:hypothetical protein
MRRGLDFRMVAERDWVMMAVWVFTRTEWGSKVWHFCRNLWGVGGERWWSWKLQRVCIQALLRNGGRSTYRPGFTWPPCAAFWKMPTDAGPNARRTHCRRGRSPGFQHLGQRPAPQGAVSHAPCCFWSQATAMRGGRLRNDAPSSAIEDSRIAKANVELIFFFFKSVSNCFPWLQKEEAEYKDILPSFCKCCSWTT